MTRWIPSLLLALMAVAAGTTADARGTFRFGGTARDLAWSAAGAPDGSLYVVGAYSGKTDFDPETAEETALAAAGRKPPSIRRLDAYLAKYDADGRFRWVVTMGGAGTNLATSVAVGGRVFVAGWFEGRVDFDRSDPPNAEDTLETKSGRDGFIAAYDPDGGFLWVHGFGDEDHAPPGDRRPAGEFSESVRGMAIDGDDNVFGIGMFSGTIDLDPGPRKAEHRSESGSRDVFVVGLDHEGNHCLGFTLGGTGMDQGHAIALTPPGGLVIGGCYSDRVDFDPGRGVETGVAVEGLDAFVAWFAADGTYEHLVTFGAAGIDQVRDGCLAVDRSGAVHVAGEFCGTVDVDPGRRRRFLTARGRSDVFVARYDQKGRLERAFSIGGEGADSAHALCLLGKNGVALTGRFKGSVDFDPGKGRTVLEAPGSDGASAAYVATFGSRGELGWARVLGAAVEGARKMTRGTGLAAHADGGITAVGTFYGDIDVDPGRETLRLDNLGDSDVFVVRYDRKGTPRR